MKKPKDKIDWKQKNQETSFINNILALVNIL